MRSLIFLTVFISMLIVQSCSDNKEKTSVAASEKKQKAAPSFKMATVQEDQPQFTITLPGELKPYEQVNIYPKIKGFVRKVYVDRGSMICKGQLLAQLEAPEIGEQFAARKSATNTAYQKYLFSKQSYHRLKQASKNAGAVAAIELERAYAQLLGDSAAYSASRSEAAATGSMQNYLRITAPFSGVITGRFISEGALVGEGGVNGAPLFQLTQQNKLRLTVAIPEKQAQALLPGTKAVFTVVDLPGKLFTGTLSRNSGALDVSSRSVIAEFDIQNPDGELRAGQYAKVKIQLMRPQPTLWIPSTSVVQAQSGVFVIKKDAGIAKRVPVQVGVERDSLIEVFGDLQAGNIVLLKGSEEVKEGTIITDN
jgi:RND family efflux transporter MFP subunit